MPSAIQYGMPLDEFWYGDMRLLDAYQKAYYRNVCFNAWKIGDYMREAVRIGASNALNKKQITKWVEFKDPMEKLEKKKPISKENMEIEFRQRQAQDKAFVQRILHRS